jgi:hypothetical protein
MNTPSSDIAFTPQVKAVQERRGSRGTYARMEARGGFRTGVTPDLVAFLADIDTAFLATANAQGQPYAQHRGGPPGFIRPLSETAVGFVDFTGNRQYVTTGNLAENDKAFLFLMDYAHRRRVKLWGRARVVADADLIARLMPADYEAEAEQAIVFEVEAWDINCPQHIPRKVDAAMAAAALVRIEAERDRLAEENAALRARLASS